MALVTAAALILGCGETIIQPIDAPASGGGGAAATTATGGNTTSAGGMGGQGAALGGGGGSDSGNGPILVLANDTAVQYFPDRDISDDWGELQSWEFEDRFPRSAVQRHDDLIVVNEVNLSAISFERIAGFAIEPMTAQAVQRHSFDLGGASSTTLLPGALHVDRQQSLWMLTGGVTLGAATPVNELMWSPGGNIDGPWVRYQSNPAAGAWVLLPDDNILASTEQGVQRLFASRKDNLIVEIEDGPDILDVYSHMQVHDGSLYAISTSQNQLHIWRDLSTTVGAPDAVIGLDDTSSPLSLAVTDGAVAIGMGVSLLSVLVFRDPGNLTSGAAPDTNVPVAAVNLAAHTWGPDDAFGRTVSIYTQHVSGGVVIEDRDGGPLEIFATYAMGASGRDILVVD